MAIITLMLDAWAHGGQAVGRHAGQVVFVPLGLPGETVRAEIVAEHARYAQAQLVEVIKPAPERVAPPCPYYGACGGCDLQHVQYPTQLQLKHEVVVEQLRRVGRQSDAVVRPVIGMDAPWEYRNHVQLMLDDRGRVGYQALRSHTVIPVAQCLLAHPLVQELWAALDLDCTALRRMTLRAGTATGEQMVLFEGDDRELPEVEVDLPVSCLYRFADGSLEVMAGDSFFHERLGGRRFRVSGPSFFQVNTSQADRMLPVVRAYLAPQPRETLLDAYCGVGTFALTYAPHVARVVAIEGSPWAIRDAQANCGAAEQVTFIAGRVERVLAQQAIVCDAAILDPPRGGCAPEALRALAECAPQRIVYVSCEPTTLARDVGRLAALGYRLVEVQPLDMFPQTHHIECVALLRHERHKV